MMEALCETSREVLGDDDPRTCLREKHLRDLKTRRSTTPLTASERQAKNEQENFVFWDEILTYS